MVAADEDALIAPRRDELPHRIVELNASLLPQHHQPDAHDRLRHRVDAEDRIRRDRPLALDLEVALRLEVRDLAPARDEREGAGELAGVDVPLEVIADASEPRRRESDFFGLHQHLILLFETARCSPSGGWWERLSRARNDWACSCACGRRGLASRLRLAPATVRAHRIARGFGLAPSLSRRRSRQLRRR